MWYDWDGALGNLMVYIQYGEKNGYTKYEVDRLATALKFSQPKTNKINCAELGLTEASLSEFGKKIRTTPEVLAKLTKYFNIASYPDVQEADLNLTAPTEDEAEDA
jgi:hypothetical protein